MPTVTALKDQNGAYGEKKKGDTWKVSPRQAKLLEEAKLVQVLTDAAAAKAEAKEATS